MARLRPRSEAGLHILDHDVDDPAGGPFQALQPRFTPTFRHPSGTSDGTLAEWERPTTLVGPRPLDGANPCNVHLTNEPPPTESPCSISHVRSSWVRRSNVPEAPSPASTARGIPDPEIRLPRPAVSTARSVPYFEIPDPPATSAVASMPPSTPWHSGMGRPTDPQEHHSGSATLRRTP